MSRRHAASVDALEERFSVVLSGLIRDQVPSVTTEGLAIAFSGGLDSSVLLFIAERYCKRKQIPLFAFHIHHGLSSHANAWRIHCEQRCQQLDVVFDTIEVNVEAKGEGVEAAARHMRYRALGQLCKQHHVPLLLTAHHLDDQAETVLMQLLRGSGTRGLSGMDDFNFAPELLASAELLLARPLLRESRFELEAFAIHHNLAAVVDESNFENRYTRNALRNLAMPALERIAPRFAQRLSRTAQHLRAANRILDELARADLKMSLAENAIDLRFLQTLSSDRVDNLLRYWLISSGVQLPSTSKFSEMRRQLFDAKHDARVQVHHHDFTLSRYDGKICLIKQNQNTPVSANYHFVWRGESEMMVPGFDGSLLFVESEIGIARDRLFGKTLVVRQRQAGMRLRLAKNRPSRDMKSHFQTLRVPFWQRDRLPFVFLDDRILYVAKLGIDAHFLSDEDAVKIEIRWKSNSTI